MVALLSSFVSFSSSCLGRSARDTSLEVSQVLSMTGDGCIGDGQECSELRLSDQITLDLQGQPRELGAICHLRSKLLVTSWWALS
jgi:hypothetical protein